KNPICKILVLFIFHYRINHQCLNRHIAKIENIVSEVEAWQQHRNNKNGKINWQFTTNDARQKLRRLYPLIYD
ncbi:MAG: hypothetical protein LC115_01060, partial [Bacteroidia bacterium]|nr:hypothetical protein [Bacteroidia bacterium]